MRKTPSQEEPLEESERYHSKSYSLPQRRRRATGAGLSPRIFHSDEHLEIPKIKRASRCSSAPDDPPFRGRVFHEPASQATGDTEKAIWHPAPSQADSLDNASKKPIPENDLPVAPAKGERGQLTSRPKLIAI